MIIFFLASFDRIQHFSTLQNISMTLIIVITSKFIAIFITTTIIITIMFHFKPLEIWHEGQDSGHAPPEELLSDIKGGKGSRMVPSDEVGFHWKAWIISCWLVIYFNSSMTWFADSPSSLSVSIRFSEMQHWQHACPMLATWILEF